MAIATNWAKVLGSIYMHDNEIKLTEKDVRLLLEEQFPELASFPLSYIQESGTENALFRLGSDYIVRLPRHVLSDDAFEKNEKTLARQMLKNIFSEEKHA